MRWGFKAEAERLADRTKTQMGLSAAEPAEVHALAQHLNMEILAADQLVDRRKLQDLAAAQDGAFSAATFHLSQDRVVIVCNPSTTRPGLAATSRTNLPTSCSAIRSGSYRPSRAFLTCDPEQEEEANWLAGCLLLPRQVLLREAFADATPEAIAAKYQVSLPMARFRLNTSGVLLQVRRARQTRFSRTPRS